MCITLVFYGVLTILAKFIVGLKIDRSKGYWMLRIMLPYNMNESFQATSLVRQINHAPIMDLVKHRSTFEQSRKTICTLAAHARQCSAAIRKKLFSTFIIEVWRTKSISADF